MNLRIERMRFLLACALLLGAGVDGWSQIITTVAGGGLGDGVHATQARIYSRGSDVAGEFRGGVFIDESGHLYLADSFNHRVRRVDAGTGIITTVAGTGDWGSSGDGGAATQARLSFPTGVFVDETGSLFIADTQNSRIRRVDGVTGIITTVAGTGDWAFSGDGGPASGASFSGPHGVFAAAAGHLYIADTGNNRIRRVDGVTGIITTVAGTGEQGFSGDSGAAIRARLASPYGVFVDGAGSLYIADTGNNRIRRVDAATGIITTVAGTGNWGLAGDSGAAIQADLALPYSVVVDAAGSLYIADTFNNRIRRVDAATGIITTVAGTDAWGFSGDGGPATEAKLGFLWGPESVAVDGPGHLYIADTGNLRVRRVDAVTGIINTVAGGGVGDGGPATQATLFSSAGMIAEARGGVFVDGSGNIYIADSRNHRIRRVDAITGIITTVAGTGAFGFAGDGGPAVQATLYLPEGVHGDASGHLYIADSDNHRIRRVDAITGIITTVAGTGAFGFAGDGGPAAEAELAFPLGVFVDRSGALYIADTFNSRVRRVDGATGLITTVAGTGQEGFAGDGAPANQAALSRPEGVFVDRSGALYIADSANHRVRRVDGATGLITTVAGTGEGDYAGAYSGDGGSATEAGLGRPEGVFVDAAGTLYIADTWNNRIRRLDAGTGLITTVAGTGDWSFSGDGGPATEAGLALPGGVFVDAAGILYIVDTWNQRIRKVTLSPTAVVDDRMLPDQTATAFALGQNYPNPFNPHTRIAYQLAQAGPVSLTVHNILGQRIRVLVQQAQAAGAYQVVWDGTDARGQAVADGVYMYRLVSGQGVLARRMLRLK